jgi:hypothetical protein
MRIQTTREAIDTIRALVHHGRDTPTYDIHLARDAHVDLEAVKGYLGDLLGRHIVGAPAIGPTSRVELDTAGRCLLRAYNVHALARRPGQRMSDLECIERAGADFEADHGAYALDAALKEVLVDFPERYPLERFQMIRELHAAATALVASR